MIVSLSNLKIYLLENCPRLRIDVPLTVFQTETLTLTFNPMRAIVMTQ